jgi:hypothetical protein
MMAFSMLPAHAETLHRVMLIAETPNKHHLTDMTVNRVFSIEVRIYVFYI